MSSMHVHTYWDFQYKRYGEGKRKIYKGELVLIYKILC